MGLSRKQVYPFGYRGFESHPLRHEAEPPFKVYGMGGATLHGGALKRAPHLSPNQSCGALLQGAAIFLRRSSSGSASWRRAPKRAPTTSPNPSTGALLRGPANLQAEPPFKDYGVGGATLHGCALKRAPHLSTYQSWNGTACTIKSKNRLSTFAVPDSILVPWGRSSS